MPTLDEALFGSPTNTTGVIREGGMSYVQIFSDTAVVLKLTQMPVHAKKQKPEIDLETFPTSHVWTMPYPPV